MGKNEVQAALDAHAPVSGPDYVPWWAKGAYARRMHTSYTTESGIAVVSGVITGQVPITNSEPLFKKKPKKPEAFEPGTPGELCDRYGLPHDLYLTAPNRGVGVMRVRNAIRKMTKE